MRIAIITIAGISSRFNEGIADEDKKLKAIYYEKDYKKTLLYQLLKKCSYADKTILVGGYKIDDLREYLQTIEFEYKDKVSVVYNEHFSDLGSGYSLYLGIKEAIKYSPKEILFVEGDLDIDNESFDSVISSDKTVLTYTSEPIYANKAVVLYKDALNNFQYAFNSSHGLLSIDSSFSCILNSGQTWKFSEVEKLKIANNRFYDEAKVDTNLRIIQNYLELGVEVDLVMLKRWTNCNTRDDYRKIVSYWED